MPRSHKTIAITGVAGFIGSNLADRLIDEGYRVIGIDNLVYGVQEQIPSKVEFHQRDIRDRSLVEILVDVDVLFHLAAKNCIPDCQNDPVDTSDINVTGSVNVFESAKRANVKKIVYAESSALYEGSSLLPTPESELAPQSVYAVSKLAGMTFAGVYQRFFGLRMTALRYFCVYGPRQDYRRSVPPVMSAFILSLSQGNQPIIYGSGEKRRDFIYVDDVNDFHLRCITDDRTDGRTYNLGSGINFSVNEIFREVAGLLGSSVVPTYLPDQPGEALHTLADISAARSLGWAPKVDLRDGLCRSIAYIQREVIPFG